MTTQRYRVLKTPLFYPTDPGVIRRIQAGENVPWPERRRKKARPGQVVSDLPAASVPGLLRKGLIEAVPDPDPAPAASEAVIYGQAQ